MKAQVHPLVVLLAICVVGEIVLSLAKQPVPPIMEHVMLVLLGVLVPSETFQPSSTQSVKETVTVTPPTEPKE